MDSDEFCGGCLLGLLAGFVISMVVYFVVERGWEGRMIEKGMAEYNSQNGKWQWKEPRASDSLADEREFLIPLGSRPEHLEQVGQEIPH